jgi:hypothetical protein
MEETAAAAIMLLLGDKKQLQWMKSFELAAFSARCMAVG